MIARATVIAAVFAVTIFAAVFAVGCYAPSIKPGQFTCANDGVCPSGFSCVCGSCVIEGDGTACGDMSGASSSHDLAGGGHDLGGMSGSPCSNGGARSTGDPGNADVALCPAAWTEAGLTGTDTPCNRQPGSNGKKGATNCSAADNCAAGWHLCASESELTGKGFTAANCSSVGSQSAFWATQQAGGPPANDGGMPSGPPVCSGATPHTIFGCGGYGMTDACTLLGRVLTSMPGSDMCATSAPPWSCAASMGHFEITVVTKSSSASGGGVICCKD